MHALASTLQEPPEHITTQYDFAAGEYDIDPDPSTKPPSPAGSAQGQTLLEGPPHGEEDDHPQIAFLWRLHLTANRLGR